MVHPQKRIDVKQVLEVVAARVVELMDLLVKWNPPNENVMAAHERSFPWENANLDDVFVDLKLLPDMLKVTVPLSLLNDQRDERLVKGNVKLKHGVERIPPDVVKLVQAVRG
ncbi:unnamed protein product [Phytophthora fragariaefolia]|uniref:Unnamed protein product n=1 Tax=Phytophthora fragariaefolia TaxID=1490495 RepID=A0A9W6TXL4_9STRA|nr:unnamed protein product [Phytophthora fragariaefolia]